MVARITTTALSEGLILPQGWDFQDDRPCLGLRRLTASNSSCRDVQDRDIGGHLQNGNSAGNRDWFPVVNHYKELIRLPV